VCASGGGENGADLLAHGLVRGSFVPPTPIQALRELTRTRKQLGREVSDHSQRIEKVLESADVKLATVLHPLLGVSGRAIVAALAAGETDPERLVALAHPRLRAKRDTLRAALPGHVRPHHRVLLRQHLRVSTRCGRRSASWTPPSAPPSPPIEPPWPTS
jgi:transposase